MYKECTVLYHLKSEILSSPSVQARGVCMFLCVSTLGLLVCFVVLTQALWEAAFLFIEPYKMSANKTRKPRNPKTARHMAYTAIELDISLHECPIFTYHLTLLWGWYSRSIWSAPITVLVINAFYAPIYLTCHYVLAYDLDVIITVRPCVLMPEANHMPQLVYHNAEFVTVLADRNSLRTIATLPNKRTASASKKKYFWWVTVLPAVGNKIVRGINIALLLYDNSVEVVNTLPLANSRINNDIL